MQQNELNVRKTTLLKLVSRSKQSIERSQTLAALARKPYLDDLEAAISGIREEYYGRTFDHSPLLNDAERKHAEQVVAVQLMRFVNGCGFVRNTTSGDVGIAYCASYSCVSVPTEGIEADDIAAPVVFERDGNFLKVTPNVFVALPNGNYTTWAVTNTEPMPAYDGVVGFLSVSWDAVAEVALAEAA